MPKYFKIVDPRGHHGMFYKEGINTDVLPFNPSGNCDPGGLYFADANWIAYFLDYGTDVYEVEPIGEVYENPYTPKKYKAHSLNMKRIGDWTKNVDTIKYLIDNIDYEHIKTFKYRMLIRAAIGGYFEILKFLIENGVDVHTWYVDEALRSASYYGHFEMVKYLVEKGADVKNDRYYALRYARNQKIKEYLEDVINKGKKE